MLVLPNGVTRIDRENCSSDRRGSRGSKEENRGSNFFRFNHSTHRGTFHPSLKIMRILGRDVGHQSVHVCWGDPIDPHPPVSPFPSQRSGQVMQRSLGGVVVRLFLRLVGNEPRHLSEGNDRSLSSFQHPFAKGSAGPENSIEVNFHDAVPGFICQVLRWGVWTRDACVRNQDVHRS